MSTRIRFVLVVLFGVILSLGMLTEVDAEERRLIKVGDPFPEIPLKAPVDPKGSAYLGISEGKSFTIKDIKADLVLVEILNVYCASCWRQVPIYNKLYSRIESDPETKGRIKMVSVGVGNEDWEVKYFIEQFDVPFPVFPDPDFVMHEAIGGSPTPFSILVKQDPAGKVGLVASTHLGVQYEQDEVFAEMRSLMNVDLATLREKGKKSEAKVVYVKPVLTEEEIQARIKGAFANEGKDLTRFEKVKLAGGREVYTGLVQREGKETRLFARIVSRPPPCDVCHDVHFIYVFDKTGKVLEFDPLQLTKKGNRDFSKADVDKIRERVVGKYIFEPFVFDAKVDSVTYATITCAVIFKGFNEGQTLFKELQQQGLI
ncbi:MAG: hypothetical protein JRI70_06845 [Deltaproteobacteria bacterium]|nr:hypothetical protein [Deltaproteobacteria bacterium]MBW1859785.1 hypothetical protein [Deltaproteobacteria bacterium]